MRTSMVMVVSGRNVRPVGIGCRFIVSVTITVLVAVMPEMCGLARCMFQRIADTYRRRVSGVQREHDGKNKREASAHDGEVYPSYGWT